VATGSAPSRIAIVIPGVAVQMLVFDHFGNGAKGFLPGRSVGVEFDAFRVGQRVAVYRGVKVEVRHARQCAKAVTLSIT
jgi:hypothetical protein